MLWPKRWLQPYGGRWLEPVRLLGACKMHPTMHLTSGHKLKQSEGEKPATQALTATAGHFLQNSERAAAVRLCVQVWVLPK